MNFSALFIGTVVGTLAAVAALVIHDSFDPGFYFLKNPVLILFPLLVAGAQAFFLGLPTLLVLNRFRRLNWITATLSGAMCASLPWLLALLGSSELVTPMTSWLALFGAIGGVMGHATARAVSPNNSSKPTPLRGAA